MPSIVVMWFACKSCCVSIPYYRLGKVNLDVSVILLIQAIGEMEILVYVEWPGMVIMGMALQENPSPTPHVIFCQS